MARFSTLQGTRMTRLASGVLLAASLLAGGLPMPAAQAGEAADGSVWRWLPPFHLKLPADWHPSTEDRSLAYFNGRHPALKFDGLAKAGISMTEDEFARLPMVALVAGIEEMPPAEEGESIGELFQKMFEAEAQSSGYKDVSFQHEPATLGNQPATLVQARFTVVSPSGVAVPSGMDVLIANEPDSGGRGHRVILMQGTGPYLEQSNGLIAAMVSGVDTERGAPLEPRSQPRVFGMERANLFVGADGTLGVLDSNVCTIWLDSLQEGQQPRVWGSCSEKEQPASDVVFAPRMERAAFDSQGLLYLAQGGAKALIQVFTADGRFEREIDLGALHKGDDHLSSFDFFQVETDGSLLVAGSLLQGKSHMLFRLTPDGSIVERTPLPDYRTLARLPDGGFILAQDTGASADQLLHLDATGKEVKRWSLPGSNQAELPGDSLSYATLESLGADESGRIYAYDAFRSTFLIYSAKGELINLVPFRPEGGVRSVAFTREGHAVAMGRRGGSLHILENSDPATITATPAPVQLTVPAETAVAPAVTEVVVDTEAAADDKPAVAELVETSQETLSVPAAVDVEPAPPTDAETVTDTDLLPELVALAADKRLNVRALRAFGKLSSEQDALALRLREKNLDLYAADLMQLQGWLDDAATTLSGFQETELKLLQELAAEMGRYAGAD